MEPPFDHGGQERVVKVIASLDKADKPRVSLQKPSHPSTLAMPLWREVLLVGIISSAQFCTQAQLAQVVALINVISEHFGIVNPGDKSWLIASYSLTVGTFILVAGRLGDMFGYKLMLTIGFSWFSLWTLVAGLAYYSNSVLFNFARALQGIGPAILLPNSLAILGSTYPPGPRKHLVFSIFGASAPTGAILGALFAGIFNLTFWPWAFWATAIVLACLAVSAVFFIPDPPPKLEARGSGLMQVLSDMDLPGGLLGVLGLILINFSWNQAGVVGWTAEPYVWVTLILGFVFIAAFFFVEIRVASAPLIPFDALTSDVAFVLVCIACGWGNFGIWLYYLWAFFLNLRHATPLLAATWSIPLVISGIAAALTTGFLLSRIRAGWVMLFSMTAFCVGTILVATTPVTQTYWAQTFVCTLVIAWGMDMSFPASTVIISDAVKPAHQGVGASLVNTFVNYSISIALGFAGTVESQTSDGNVLRGYRSAWYLGIGLSGLGMCFATIFLLKSYWRDWRHTKKASSDSSLEM